MKNKISLETENQILRQIIYDTLWMARRYAHNRRTFAPTTVNEAIDELLKLGIKIEEDSACESDIGYFEKKPRLYCDDGDFGKWNPIKQKFEKE